MLARLFPAAMAMAMAAVAAAQPSTAIDPAVAAQLEEMRALITQQQQTIQSLNERVESLEQEKQQAAGAEESAAAAPEAAAAGGGAPAAGSDEEITMSATWDNGLAVSSEDGDFEIKLNGRVHVDAAWFDHDDEYDIIGAFFPEYGLNDEHDGVEFRRTRLSVSGKFYENYSFQTEVDFAVDSPGSDGAVFRHVWMAADNLPYLGTLKVGHFKEPFSLEELTSSNSITFMERSLANTFSPAFNLGVAANNTFADQRMTWSLGAFKTVDNWPSDNDSDEDQGYQITARVTGLPWYRDKGRRLVHLGASYSHRNPDGLIRFNNSPESNLANDYVNTGRFRADDLNLYGLEAAMVVGPWSIQGEHITADVESEFADATFDGYYLQTSYVLTGEHREYKRGSGAFGGVTPKRNFSLRGEERGWGAWEVAARYSALDLEDEIIAGGEIDDITLGLNWYLNPNMRIMLNYVHADIDHQLYNSDVDILQTRFQLNF